MKNLLKKIICKYYSWRDDIVFEKGYEYLKITHTELDQLETHHRILLDDGYKKVSDVNCNFSKAWCWYRKPNK
jgi:hypothetical protein